jgi:hypothetical protein
MSQETTLAIIAIVAVFGLLGGTLIIGHHVQARSPVGACAENNAHLGFHNGSSAVCGSLHP